MKSLVHWGRVDHWREGPVPHSFTYPVFTFMLHLEEIPDLGRRGILFRHNRPGIFSLYDRDYLYEGSEPLLEKLRTLYRERGIEFPSSFRLVTVPRFFGYVFNPVSFYFGIRDDGSLGSLLCEVNNTFGEKHLYLYPYAPDGIHFEKAFYVSPFLEVAGEYEVAVAQYDENLEISVRLKRDNKTIFGATLVGRGRELTSSSLIATLIRFPFSAALTMTRIHIQGLILYFRRSATIFRKPEKLSTNTVRVRPGFVERSRLRILSLMRRKRSA